MDDPTETKAGSEQILENFRRYLHAIPPSRIIPDEMKTSCQEPYLKKPGCTK